MANQYKINSYSVTAGGIVLNVTFKRTADISALPNSAENIMYATGTTKDFIISDLEARANSKVNTYQNDELVKATFTLDQWIDVVVPK